MTLVVKIKKVGDAPGFSIPCYMSEGASGMDLHAALPGVLSLKPMQRDLIPCGFSIEIPEGYEAQVRPRSGLAIKFGITCLNSPGTIDHDYRGEVKVVLINLGSEVFEIKPGDRIAQLVIQKVERVTVQLVEEVNSTQRGGGGFGSTGH
jgi:dUTP diphosphatase